MNDPLVEEVYKHQMELSRRLRSDLSAIGTDLRSIQIASWQEVCHLSPTKPEPTKASGCHVKPCGRCLGTFRI